MFYFLNHEIRITYISVGSSVFGRRRREEEMERKEGVGGRRGREEGKKGKKKRKEGRNLAHTQKHKLSGTLKELVMFLFNYHPPKPVKPIILKIHEIKEQSFTM